MLIVSTAIFTIFTTIFFSNFTIIFEVLVNVTKRKKVYKRQFKHLGESKTITLCGWHIAHLKTLIDFTINYK